MIDGDVVLLDFLALHVEGRITVLDRERPPGLLLGGRRCDQADRQGQKHETGYQPPMTLHRRPPVLDLPAATLAGGRLRCRNHPVSSRAFPRCRNQSECRRRVDPEQHRGLRARVHPCVQGSAFEVHAVTRVKLVPLAAVERDFKATGEHMNELLSLVGILPSTARARAEREPLAVHRAAPFSQLLDLDSVAQHRKHPVVPSSSRDRKSTRLNSSHTVISYAVFCLKKKKKL